MKNPIGINQIKLLEQRIYGKGSKFLKQAYIDSTKKNPYSYILLDFNKETSDNLRVRTNIFPTDERNLISKMSTNVNNRWTIAQCLSHRFIRYRVTTTSTTTRPKTMNALANFIARRELKEAIL
jgi:competence CoiA-like predicted nuclease